MDGAQANQADTANANTETKTDPMHPAERKLRDALALAREAHDAAVAAGFRIEPANFRQLLEQLAISETARVVRELEQKAEGEGQQA